MSIFYGSLRVGRDGRRFRLWKLRTMRADGGTPTASSQDPRLTATGRLLRRLKLDELPTLWNVLEGEMGLVGPRPDVPEELESLDASVREKVLSVRPGLVSPATIWNLNEDETLRDCPDPHGAYVKFIKPIKYSLNVWYVDRKSPWMDAKVLAFAFLRLMGLRPDPRRMGVLPDWCGERPLIPGNWRRTQGPPR